MIPNVDYWNMAVFNPEFRNDWSEVDQMYRFPSDARIESIAREMDRAKQGQPDSANVSGYDPAEMRRTGLFGERAFCRIFGTPMDLGVKRYGSMRRNAILKDGTVIDVVTRTARKNGEYPDLTIRKLGKKGAKVYVLLIWIGPSYEPVLYGWCTAQEARERGVSSMFRSGTPNTVVGHNDLNPMHLLMQRHRSYSPLAKEDAYPSVEMPVPDQSLVATGPVVSQLELL